MITIPPDALLAIATGRARLRFWWRVDTDPVTAVWTGRHELVRDGITYRPVPVATPPAFGQSSADRAVRPTTVELPAPPGLGLDAMFDTTDIALRTVRAGIVIADSAGTELFWMQRHRGRVDDIQIIETSREAALLRVETTTRTADARNDQGQLASDSDQRARRDAIDGYFKRLALAQDVEVIIGGRGPAPAGGGGSRGTTGVVGKLVKQL